MTWLAGSLNNLALLYWNMGNYAQAEPLYQQALKIRHKPLGDEHPDVAQTRNSLAELHQKAPERREPGGISQ
jgi:tetratricopeptide (TPR) repeat protein